MASVLTREIEEKFEELRRDLLRLGMEFPPIPETRTTRDGLLLQLVSKAPEGLQPAQHLQFVVSTFLHLYPLTHEYEQLPFNHAENLKGICVEMLAELAKAAERQRRLTRSRRAHPTRPRD